MSDSESPSHTEREKIVKELKRVDNKTGGRLTPEKFKEYGRFSVHDVIHTLGPWKQAVRSVEDRPVYSKNDVLERIAEASKFFEPPLTLDNFYSKTGIDSNVVYRFFDSWTGAKKEAGLCGEEESFPYKGREVSREDVIETLKGLEKDLGRPPKTRDLEKSSITVRQLYNHYDSFSQALEDACIEPDSPGNRRYSNEEIIEELNKVYSGENHTSSTLFKQESSIGLTTVVNRFGSWTDALKAADITPQDNNGKIPEEDVLQELRDVSKKVEGSMSSVDFNKVSDNSASLMVQKFGSWEEAKKQAGLPINSDQDR